MRIMLILVVAGTAFAQVGIHPYTLKTVSRQYDRAGNLVSESRFLTAVDKTGSLVTVDLDPSRGGARQILDVVNHRVILVEPRSAMASSAPYDWAPETRACEDRFRAIRDARVTVDRSAGAIQGVPVERVLVDLPDRRMEVFLAPSLACEMLRVTDTRNGVPLDTSAAEELKVGDPDPRLFAIPADYRWIR
ncbi:MAG TPA: hypothetical protein VFA04_23130 [Bryobacteraceae bacterium]|nr:hypothetical protein [Bryobacteraceae bacterium]